MNYSTHVSGRISQTLTNKASFSAYFEPFIQLFKPEWRYAQISARVINKKSENYKIYTVTLKPESRWGNFKAGQFVTLSVEINGRFLSRTFSISSAPKDFKEDGLIQISICEQTKGAVTPWLRAHLESGDTVYIAKAQGEFCLQHKRKKIFIAGGSGITPIRSMLLESRNQAWLADAHLFFYQDQPEEAIFNEELEALKQSGLSVHRFFSNQDGFICLKHLQDALKLKQIPAQDFFEHTEAYICGPGQMIASSKALLEQAGLDSAFIYYEYFGRAPLSATTQRALQNQHDELIQVDYLHSGKQVQFTGSINKSLLELAEEQGLKPVSGCRMGICHQCICKKKTGRVFNTKTQELSDSGPEDIQLCLSVPVGSVELEL